jgi:sugar O-acyltransferase (sialic acid O-acetyltransferase NeuD family)|tara:strand:- start:16985 stop:17593 length:609 start_codon:yes stop_codon:yes gene_type:complete
MKKKIIIFGNGNHAKIVEAEINKLKNYILIKKITNDKDIINFDRKIDSNTYGVVAIGSNYIREKIVKNIKKIKPDFKWTSIISKDALVADKTRIGDGSIIISGSIINIGTIIGKHCSINTGSIIEHDNFFEDFSSIGPGAVTGGNVSIGKRSFLGIGSSVKDNIKIGSDCIIGGQSFVNKNCNKNELLFGVPAKKINKKKKI